jgi:multiple sugar transport system permease protein
MDAVHVLDPAGRALVGESRALFRALDAFKIFDLVYMFTQGAPGTSTETVSWYIYRLGNQFFRMGYASAVAYLVLIMLSFVATLYVGRFVREGRA